MPTELDTAKTSPIMPQQQANVTAATPGETSYYIFGNTQKETFPWKQDSSAPSTKKTPLFIDTFLSQNKGIKALNVFAKEVQEVQIEKQTPTINIDGSPLARTVQTHFWFTPCMFILFVLYAFTLASRKKMLSKEVRNFFTPTSSGEMTVNTPIEEIQQQLPLLGLATGNIAWLAFFCINTFLHTTEIPSIAWISSTIAIGATLAFQLTIIQAICYVFFDGETFHKLEKLKLISFSLMGIVLIPSVLMLAYSPTFFIKPAIYSGIITISLVFLLYLLRSLPFFFKGTLSIFYLILYLCTIEILPAIALIIGLERII